MRMIQLGKRACLARESLSEGRVRAHFGRQNLHRHNAIKLFLPGLIDSPHPALAQ